MSEDGITALRKFVSRYYKELRYGSLKDALNEYCKVITANLPTFELNDPSSLLNSIIEIKDSILEAENDFLYGFIGDCYNKIYDLLFVKYSPKKLGIICEIDEGVIFFRMRSVDNQYLLQPNELNHIPFNKRESTSNQRYSLSGFPCLYLGTSVYVCWEELNRPNIYTANVAPFFTRKKLRLLNLVYSETGYKSDEQRIYRCMLMIANSLTRKKSESAYFKREYIIPQAILHSIVKWNKRKRIRLDGIAYLSTRFKKEGMLYNLDHRFLNIVIPTKLNIHINDSVKEDQYCKHIEKLFKHNKVYSLSIFNLQGSGNVFIPDSGPYEGDPYLDSEFYKLESYIRNKHIPNKYFWDTHIDCSRREVDND